LPGKLTYSLLVPCYNAAAYTDGFIKHISELNKPFDEVIFYDDASNDTTVQILTDAGFDVIQGKINKGPGYARNRLAEKAKSGYIHFHDIDDEFNPAFLNLVNHKINNAEPDVVFGNADWIDAVTRDKIIQWRYSAGEVEENALSYFVSHPLGVINTVYKREAFLSVGGFDENIKCWEDADLHVKLAAAGCSFTFINEVLAYSLRHSNGISKDQLWCWGCRLKFIERYLTEYPQLNKTVFELELKKVQNAFVITGEFKQLSRIIRLKKKYRLALNTNKIAVLYYLNKLFSSSFILRMLRLKMSGHLR